MGIQNQFDIQSLESSDRPSARQYLLVVITIILVAAALKITQPVTLPLTFALFLIAVFWPLYQRLQRRIPAGFAALITLLAFLAVIGVLLAALWYSFTLTAPQLPKYAAQIERYESQARTWGQSIGVTIPENWLRLPADPVTAAFRSQIASRAAGIVGTLGAALALVGALLVLGMLEVNEFRAKLDRVAKTDKGKRFVEALPNISREIQRYVLLRSATGLIAGVSIGAFAWLYGLDFAFVWGSMNFLLNFYLPQIGSLIAIVFTTLFALVQYDTLGPVLVVLVFTGGFQLLVGSFIGPRLFGRFLSLSPVVVLLSVIFWGWLWGIAGAFIGVPILIFTVIACSQFDQTRWITTLIARRNDADE